MCNSDKFNLKRRQCDLATLLNHVNANIWSPRLHQALCLQQASCKRRCIDRTFQFGPKLRNSTDMIFMGMGYNQREKILSDLFDKANVRHNQVNTGQIISREGYAKIHHNPFAGFFRPEAIKPAIHSYFAKATERYKN